MTASFLLFGALLGIRHALEADHVAAVASLATRARSAGEIFRVSAAWGFGHALTLVVFGSLVIALGMTLSDEVSRAFEMAVGVMLVLLGADVLRRMRRSRLHVHPHEHEDGTVHLHVHRHEESPGGGGERPVAHEHRHPPLARAVLVGGVHGLAGSAALILLSLQATESTLAAVGYLVAFGVGSILGMVSFSLAISVPLGISARRFESSVRGIETALGCVTIAIGAWVTGHAGGAF